MIIKVERSLCMFGFAYQPGEELNCDDKFAKKIIEIGFATKVRDSTDGHTFDVTSVVEWDAKRRKERVKD